MFYCMFYRHGSLWHGVSARNTSVEEIAPSWCSTQLGHFCEPASGPFCPHVFFAEVEYEKPAADLHTELFAKIPFPLAGNTLSDRMASSVMQKLVPKIGQNCDRPL